jgi:hypothetical protein
VQHTPSTQTPDAHSELVLQAVPAPFWSLQTPPEQNWLLLQSLSATQAFGPPVHRSSAQVYPAGQVSWLSAGQCPAPSQNATSVAMPFSHLGSWHETPGPG